MLSPKIETERLILRQWKFNDIDDMVHRNTKLAKEALGLEKGDKVIVTAGISDGKKEKVTNLIKIEEI